MAADPGEQNDLAASRRDVVERLEVIRERWWLSVKAEPRFLPSSVPLKERAAKAGVTETPEEKAPPE